METKRQFSGEFKLQVVMESYQRDTTIEAVCRKLGSQYTFFLQIYAEQGVRNDEDNMNNSQFWQKQYGDNIVDHYEVLDSVNKVYEVFLPPLKIFEGNGENMQIFYRVETFKYAAGNLVDPNHIDYQSFNLTTRKQEYKFHRSPRGVETLAKINYAPYTNQWIDEHGNHYVPGHGQYACGPTSAMMAAGAKGKLSSTDYASLRSYVFDDSKWNAEGISQNEKSCGTYSGAFARVMESCGYLATDWSKLKSMYNNSFKLSIDQAVQEWSQVASNDNTIYQKIKEYIDDGYLIHTGISVPNVGHQNLIVGYGVNSDKFWRTQGYANSFIVNDSFTDMTIDDNGDGLLDRGINGYVPYSSSGKQAVYFLGKNGIALGNFIKVK